MPLFDKTWWLEHGATYKDEFLGGPAYEAQESAVAEVLSLLRRVKFIIEVGCGFGRITKIVNERFPEASYLATDVSLDAMRRADEYLHLDGLAFHVFDLDEDDPEELGGPADLVIASEVLLHRTPEQVKEDVKKLKDLSRKYIINIDWYEPGAGEADGCYQHDYTALFSDFGIVTRIDVPEARQAIWLTEIGA